MPNIISSSLSGDAFRYLLSITINALSGNSFDVGSLGVGFDGAFPSVTLTNMTMTNASPKPVHNSHLDQALPILPPRLRLLLLQLQPPPPLLLLLLLLFIILTLPFSLPLYLATSLLSSPLFLHADVSNHLSKPFFIPFCLRLKKRNKKKDTKSLFF